MSVQNEKEKYCSNCRHAFAVMGSREPFLCCNHPDSQRDPVMGAIYSVEFTRGRGGRCGEGAELFEVL